MLNKYKGFTLIELVIVIIILGVLATVAAPRLINISSDAKVSVIQSIHGSIASALKILHMKAQIGNKLGKNDIVKTPFGDFEFHNGYPETKSDATTIHLYFVPTFLDLGEVSNEIKNNFQRFANYGELTVFEDNRVSRVGYGTGTLISGLCYSEFYNSGSVVRRGIKTSGC